MAVDRDGPYRWSDAIARVAQVQQAQERWRANNSTYATLTQLGIGATTADGHYSLSITGSPTATSYQVLATATGAQASDTLHLPLAAVEGFIRQVLGWREFVRGASGEFLQQLAEGNFFGHARRLPRWYWTGDTRMNCMRAVIGQTLQHGDAHHNRRLMVTGQFALLAEIDPREVCGLVPRRLRRSGRVGRAAQYRRHGAVRRRRPLHQQAVRGQRGVHQAAEQLLCGLRLPARRTHRSSGLPSQHPVLALPGSATSAGWRPDRAPG